MSWPASPANSGSASRPFGTWVRQAEIDVGSRPGVTTEDKGRIAELEKELRELPRANAILKSASAFFAADSTAQPSSPLHHDTPPGVRGRADL